MSTSKLYFFYAYFFQKQQLKTEESKININSRVKEVGNNSNANKMKFLIPNYRHQQSLINLIIMYNRNPVGCIPSINGHLDETGIDIHHSTYTPYVHIFFRPKYPCLCARLLGYCSGSSGLWYIDKYLRLQEQRIFFISFVLFCHSTIYDRSDMKTRSLSAIDK